MTYVIITTVIAAVAFTAGVLFAANNPKWAGRFHFAAKKAEAAAKSLTSDTPKSS